MEIIYDGKTKRVMRDGRKVLLQFKDTVTGDAHGKLDTGGDFVVGSVEGKGVREPDHGQNGALNLLCR